MLMILETNYGSSERGFAAPGFADKSNDLAGI
ncbi:hypothetical protein X771_14800 [Mesorhizobium sp. LSJC277A00]|nr:hypothetical protein X771_14800 [Mesorhizobium sp. LSJC277A00]ESX10512.1 hypothetical protein X768_14555 [Mesorhizobium sp. LSJC265A00]